MAAEEPPEPPNTGAVPSQVTAAESVTLRVQVFSNFLTNAEWKCVQLKPRDTIREMLAQLLGCAGDDVIDTFDFRKPDFAARSFYSCTARVKKKSCVSALVSNSGHSGLFVNEFENKGSVHWLRQGDEPGEEFLKRAYQQAADEITPGPAFSASGSLESAGRLAWLQAPTGSVVFDVAH